MFDSPERKATLDKSLREAIRKITDPSLRAHYGEEIKRLRWDLFGTKPAQFQRKPGWNKAPMGATPGAKQSALAAVEGAVEDQLREAVILAVLVTHPSLIEQFEDQLEALDCTAPDHNALRTALLRNAGAEPVEMARQIGEQIGPAPLEKLMAQSHIQIVPAIRNPNDTEQAVLCVAEELAKLAAKRGAAREVSEAMQDIDHLVDEGLTWRLGQAAQARHKAETGQTEDKTEYETAPSGAKIKKDERSAFDALLEGIRFSKGANRPN